MSLLIYLTGRDSQDYRVLAESIGQLNLSLDCDLQVGQLEAQTTTIFSQQLPNSNGLKLLQHYAAQLAEHGQPPAQETVIGITTQLYWQVLAEAGNFPHLLGYPVEARLPAYFLPIDLAAPVWLMAAEQRCYIGSSSRLLSELDQLNLTLSVPKDYGETDPRKYQQLIGDSVWSAAKYCWGILHWLSYESLRGRWLMKIEEKKWSVIGGL